MANFETLAVSVDDTIGRIQLNRPAQLNPLSTACLRLSGMRITPHL